MDDDFWDPWEYYEPEEPEQLPRDTAIDDAKNTLIDFFENNKEKVFYYKQLQVKFEKKHFHWITQAAISELIKEGFIGLKKEPLHEKTSVSFVFYPPKWRYYKRPIKNSLIVVREYSHHTTAIACGEQADVLFMNALLTRGFICNGQDTNEFNNKKWTQTGHDLDFIIQKDGIVYGCEVKNTFDYISTEQLNIKLKICEYLGIKPMFIMRYSPKSYNNQIINAGGYVMIFEFQIYPFGQNGLVNRIRAVLELPVDCPRAIPAGIIDRFMRWHNKQVPRA